MARLSLLVLLLGAWSCAPPTACPCFICDAAVTLAVVDSDGAGVDGFVVAHAVNGEARGEPQACAPATREDNTCSFGVEIGVYHLVVSAPGFRPREAVVRVAEGAGSDLCCNRCLAGTDLTLQLEPL